jgi:hypothetical protein
MPINQKVTENMLDSLISACKDYKAILERKNRDINSGKPVWFIETKHGDAEDYLKRENREGFYTYNRELALGRATEEADKKTKDNSREDQIWNVLEDDTVSSANVTENREKPEQVLSKMERTWVRNKGLTQEEKDAKILLNENRSKSLDKMIQALENTAATLEDRFTSALTIYKEKRNDFKLDYEEIHKKQEKAQRRVEKQMVTIIAFLPIMLGFLPISLLIPLLSSKKSSEEFTDKVKHALSNNIIDALENQCLDFIKRLDHDDKVKRTVIKSLIKTLKSNKPDSEKVKDFKITFDQITQKSAWLADNSTATKKFIYTVGHLLATIITLGFYASLRAKYSGDFTGSMRFWDSKEDVFRKNINRITDRSPGVKKS